MGGTIFFGLRLAFSVGGYDIRDGWIIAVIVLWLVGVASAMLVIVVAILAAALVAIWAMAGKPG